MFRSQPLRESPHDRVSIRRLTVRRRGALAAAGCLACIAAAAALGPGPAASAADAPQGGFSHIFDLTTLADSGPGSLRAAITAADAATGSSDIVFSVSGTIALQSALPSITAEITINGVTAPGYASGGPPAVEIDCGGHGGLDFAATSTGSQLLGIAVVAAAGTGVTLEAGSITVNDDYIGIDTAGQRDGNRGDGIFVAAASSSDLIGLNPAGDSGTVANVISGNEGNGLVLSGSAKDTVVANRIGTNPAGTAAMPNGGDGILITQGARDNEIGGTEYTDAGTGQVNNPTGSKGTVTPVFVVPPLGNLVSGNYGDGVAIFARSQQNTLNGNFIGTTADGDAALGNRGNGVYVDSANSNALTGCKFVNNPFVYYNVISGNKQDGLLITNSNGTLVQGNFFGPAPTTPPPSATG